MLTLSGESITPYLNTVTKTSIKKKGEQLPQKNSENRRKIQDVLVRIQVTARQVAWNLSVHRLMRRNDVDGKRQESHTSLRLFNVWFSLSAFPKICCQPDHDVLSAWVPNLMCRVSKVGIFIALTINSIAPSGGIFSSCLWVSMIATMPKKKRNKDIQSSQTSVFGQSLT